MATFYQQMSKDGIGRIGRLDEPQTAGCDYLPAGCSEEQRDDSATQTNEILKEQLDTGGAKVEVEQSSTSKISKAGETAWAKALEGIRQHCNARHDPWLASDTGRTQKYSKQF
jgi:hypothetical protein